jgi:hypothetical protein
VGVSTTEQLFLLTSLRDHPSVLGHKRTLASRGCRHGYLDTCGESAPRHIGLILYGGLVAGNELLRDRRSSAVTW